MIKTIAKTVSEESLSSIFIITYVPGFVQKFIQELLHTLPQKCLRGPKCIEDLFGDFLREFCTVSHRDSAISQAPNCFKDFKQILHGLLQKFNVDLFRNLLVIHLETLKNHKKNIATIKIENHPSISSKKFSMDSCKSSRNV